MDNLLLSVFLLAVIFGRESLTVFHLALAVCLPSSSSVAVILGEFSWLLNFETFLWACIPGGLFIPSLLVIPFSSMLGMGFKPIRPLVKSVSDRML